MLFRSLIAIVIVIAIGHGVDNDDDCNCGYDKDEDAGFADSVSFANLGGAIRILSNVPAVSPP